jgi:hypothetical protein
MLAPRKTLWSTPLEVIDAAITSLKINAADVVYDVGCGDGRFVLRCHEVTKARCIGIEIDDVRADQAAAAVAAKGVSGPCTIVKGNALDQDYTAGTVFFLYLVPRGLKIMLPLLQVSPGWAMASLHPLNNTLFMVAWCSAFRGRSVWPRT